MDRQAQITRRNSLFKKAKGRIVLEAIYKERLDPRYVLLLADIYRMLIQDVFIIIYVCSIYSKRKLAFTIDPQNEGGL